MVLPFLLLGGFFCLVSPWFILLLYREVGRSMVLRSPFRLEIHGSPFSSIFRLLPFSVPLLLYLEVGRSMVLPFLQIGDSWFSLLFYILAYAFSKNQWHGSPLSSICRLSLFSVPFLLNVEAGRSMVLPFLQIGDSWFSFFFYILVFAFF